MNKLDPSLHPLNLNGRFSDVGPVKPRRYVLDLGEVVTKVCMFTIFGGVLKFAHDGNQTQSGLRQM